MKQYNLEKVDLWISEDMFKKDFVNLKIDDSDEKIRKLLNHRFSFYLENQSPEYGEYANLYGKLDKLDKFAMLIAEGGVKGDLKNKIWTYYDNEEEYLVQDWINSVDGKYHSLLFLVCNLGVCEPTSKKSLLFVPDREIAEAQALDLGTCCSLYVPKIGMVNDYTIGYELNELKGKINMEEAE